MASNTTETLRSVGTKISGKYQHQPLKSPEKEARLLELNPGDISTPLSCKIHSVDVEDTPLPYEAVSYTWALQNGDASLSSEISVEPTDTVVMISTSCENMLRRLRHTIEKRLLWVDMVCIDQSNTGERNHQVGLMKTIYSNSRCVLIDVGYHPEGVEVFEYLSLDPKKFKQKYGRDIARSNAFRILFSLRWFHRVWVLQEVTLSKKAFIFCGPVCIPWSWLYRFLDGYIHQQAESSSLTQSNLERIRPPACSVYILIKNQSRPSLLDLLIASRPCQCFDERDKVYALFGLLHHSQIPFEPDYSKCYEEVYTDVAGNIIQSTRDLRILNSIQPQENPRLPSWVPDWTRPCDESWAGLPDIFGTRDDLEGISQTLDAFHVGNPWSTTPQQRRFNGLELRKPIFSPPIVISPSNYPSEMPTLEVTAYRVANIWNFGHVDPDELRRVMHEDCRGPEDGFGETVRRQFQERPQFRESVYREFWSTIAALKDFETSPIPWVFHSEVSAELNRIPADLNRTSARLKRICSELVLMSERLKFAQKRRISSERSEISSEPYRISVKLSRMSSELDSISREFWSAVPMLRNSIIFEVSTELNRIITQLTRISSELEQIHEEVERISSELEQIHEEVKLNQISSNLKRMPSEVSRVSDELNERWNSYYKFRLGQRVSRLIGDAALYSSNLCGFLTETSIGFGPVNTRSGDSIWRIDGARKWMVLRRYNQNYRIIGPCYFFSDHDETIRANDEMMKCPSCQEKIQRSPWQKIEIS